MMKKENVEILACSFGNKRVVSRFHEKKEDLNYKVENERYPHDDLKRALSDLDTYLAKAMHSSSDDFTATGFKLDERDEIKTVEIEGNLTNPWGYLQKVKSGKIPLDNETEELQDSLDVIANELVLFYWENKSADPELFPAEPKVTKEEIEVQAKDVMENEFPMTEEDATEEPAEEREDPDLFEEQVFTTKGREN